MHWFAKKHILVPFDFSDESCAAVDTVLQMVDDSGSVSVVHVLPVLAASEPGVVWEEVGDDTRREHVAKALQDRFSDEKYQGLKFAVRFGDPGLEITAYAEEIKAELIVLPSHGRTGIKRLLLGSVAERVCRLAHVPVLVLKH